MFSAVAHRAFRRSLNAFIGFCGAVLAPGSAEAIDTPFTLRQGAVYSTAQSGSQSYFRFYNSGATAGTVKVTLSDAAGAALAQWTSPSIPAGAAVQYYVGDVEAAATKAFTKPQLYAVAIEPQITGRYQHVLYRPADGTLTNLSTCDAGTGASATVLTHVHTTVLDNGFPSSIVVGNTGAAATSVQLGIYAAASGAKLGTYTTPEIAVRGQAIITIAALEAAARIIPTSSMYHYVVKAETPFTGVLQHLVNNTKVGVTTDMTTTCNMTYAAPTPPPSVVNQSAVVSSAQPAVQSYLRFYNSGPSAGSVSVTLSDQNSGEAVAQWTSPSIPVGAAEQFYIGDIEAAAGVAHKSEYYTVTVRPQITGLYQHVLYRPADGTITNLTTCDAGNSASATTLTHVHTSTLGSGFPSTVVIENTGILAKAVPLGIYDGRSGQRLGFYRSPAIAPNSQMAIPVSTIEAAANIAPTATRYHYVIKAEGAFTGFLQHLVNNTQVGVTADMTTTCAMQNVATFAEVRPATFSAALPVTPVVAVKADAPTKTSSLAYLLATQYGFGNLFGNGRNDIVVAPSYLDQRNEIPIEFWSNNGDGTFTNRTSDLLDTPLTTEGVGNVFVADLNSDGRDDVFMVDTGWEKKPQPYIGAFNKLILSGPDGKLHDASATLPQDTKSYNHRSTMIDFNGDGCQDFIITELGQAPIPTSNVYVLLNDCAGHFSKFLDLPPGVRQRTRGVVTGDLTPDNTVGAYHTTAADLNGDGKVELIVGGTNQTAQTRVVRIYDGATNFAEVARLSLPSALTSLSPVPAPVSIVPYDIDGDGRRDLILHLEASGTTKFHWVIFRNLGNYQFADVTLQYVPSYEISSLPGGNGNMRKMVLKEVSKNVHALVIECGQFSIADALKNGRCIFQLGGPTITAWQPAVGGHAISDADIDALAPQRSWTCPVRGGTQLVFDVDGDGVMDLVYVNGQCVSQGTAELPQMSNSLQVVTFPVRKAVGGINYAASGRRQRPSYPLNPLVIWATTSAAFC